MEIVKFALTLHYIVDINKYIYFIDIVNQTQSDLFYFLFLIEVEDDKVYFYTNTTLCIEKHLKRRSGNFGQTFGLICDSQSYKMI